MTVKSASEAARDRKRIRKQRRWLQRIAVAGVLTGLGMGTWAFEDATPSEGLKGILPAEVPAQFSAEGFSALGPSWEGWSQGTVEAIASFYKLEGDAAAQAAALKKVQAKLGVLNKAIADDKYAMIHESLISLRGPLARRVAVAEAALATLQADPAAARKAAVAGTAKTVEAAVGSLQTSLDTIPGGKAWFPFIKADVLLSAWGNSVEDAATVAALEATKSRLASRATLTDAAQKEFLSRPEFKALEQAIDAHLAALSLKSQGVDVAKTRAALAALVAALEDYEFSNSSVAAAQVRKAAAELSEVAPDGGAAIKKALADNYYNYNVRIVASEPFLNRLLSDSRTEQGRVSDFVLGASVGGWQTTSTTVSVDLKPAADRVRFDLVLSGTVQSSTAGSTDQATIYTSGYHTFRSTKEVVFDGSKFTTGPASTAVNANNTTTGASTRFSGGLLGPMAQRIAMREAAARRPQAEAITRGRVAGNVTPKFDEEVNKSFARATEQINGELMQGLKNSGIYPEQIAYASSDTEFRMSSRLMGSERLGGYAAESRLLSAGSGAAMAMHESVVNNTIDQIGFNGKKMSESELRTHLEEFLSKALSREFKFQTPAAAADPEAKDAADGDEDNTPAQLVFAAEDAIRIQFRDGEMLLVIRAGLEREGGEPIPTQEIVVPLKFAVSGDKILISRDALQIYPVEGESKPIQQRVMNSRISKALPDREVSGVFKLRGPSREVDATVTSIRIVDGWIALHVQ